MVASMYYAVSSILSDSLSIFKHYNIIPVRIKKKLILTLKVLLTYMNDFSEQEKESFYKAIYSRRDVRSNFTSESIDDQVLTRILKAAHHAPSVGFSQPWNFILVKNIETSKKIK